jgi:phage tail sheath protein FI
MINLLANQDDYRFNVLLTPGLFAQTANLGASQVTTAINNTQNRGDSIYVVDLVPFNSSINTVTTQANSKNTSYAASYWPWVQTIDPDSAQLVWVPASTMVGGVYAYNDSVSEPWFAPAGINRGGLGNVVRAEKKLSQANRDTLYINKVNPIATFPGTGVVVYGQKTLQTKASALDRVNVRRLLISLKSYISQVANNLVFEQNTIATRNAFLSQVNPYLESVQQKQGLYAFRVIMNETNNTADVIDRNELIGQIYIQPTRTAEFIYLDFNILPTGATFPA